LAQGDMVKSLAMVVLGLLLGIVGTDVNTGVQRFSFGVTELSDGIGFIVVAVGVFAIGEIVSKPRRSGRARGLHRQGDQSLAPPKTTFALVLADHARHRARRVLRRASPAPGRRSRRLRPTCSRRSLRTIPPALARARSRAWRRRNPPNNADAQCKFIPMLTLGLPASGVMALMLARLQIQGIQPGPEVMTLRPDLFWG